MWFVAVSLLLSCSLLPLQLSKSLCSKNFKCCDVKFMPGDRSSLSIRKSYTEIIFSKSRRLGKLCIV